MWDDVERDRPLTANLILVTWRIDGANERLLGRLRTDSVDWLRDPLLLEYPPSRFERSLLEPARSQPERFKEAVYEFLWRWDR